MYSFLLPYRFFLDFLNTKIYIIFGITKRFPTIFELVAIYLLNVCACIALHINILYV